MGHYTIFKTKLLKLRKDTPDEVISFLNDAINNHTFDFTPNHVLFACSRYYNIFWSSPEISYLDEIGIKNKTFFRKNKNGIYELFIHCELKNYEEEIENFIDWIRPYIAGHKQNEFIGFIVYDGIDLYTVFNVYANKQRIKQKTLNLLSWQQREKITNHKTQKPC